jgi:hypothetical protein
LGATQPSSQLGEWNVSKSLLRLSNVDLPRGIALCLSAKRAEHIPSTAKGGEQHFVDHGYRIDSVPALEQSPAVARRRDSSSFIVSPTSRIKPSLVELVKSGHELRLCPMDRAWSAPPNLLNPRKLKVGARNKPRQFSKSSAATVITSRIRLLAAWISMTRLSAMT